MKSRPSILPLGQLRAMTSEILFRMREAAARAERRSLPQPHDDPTVVAAARPLSRPRTVRGIPAIPQPLRILLVGSPSRITLGVITHELGLGGHLARRLARELERPVELTVTATESPIARLRPTLRGLRGFDVVVLALGDRELGEHRRPAAVQRDLELLLEQLASEPTAIETFVLSLPAAGTASATEGVSVRDIRRSTDNIQFNSALEAAAVSTGSATWVPFAPCPWADAARDRSRVRSSRTYDRWAALIVPALVSTLAADRRRRAANDLGFRPVVTLERRPNLPLAV